ncbi:MAG: ATP-binding cassette domain-containing protein [Desulfotalea sp.]
MIELKDVNISFRGNKKKQNISKLKDVSITINRGEIVALIGASGAGKSLLANTLLGILPSNAQLSGTFSYNGNKLSYHELKQLRGRIISLIPQSVTYLNPLLKVKKQIHRSACLSGRCHQDAHQETDLSCSRYRLDSKINTMLPFQISGGMARRVLTATATAGLANFIIADEPTTGLDKAVCQESLCHLRELADEGRGVLMITHDLEAAIQIADKITVIRDGEIVQTIKPFHFKNGLEELHHYTKTLWDCLPQNNFVQSATLPSN